MWEPVLAWMGQLGEAKNAQNRDQLHMKEMSEGSGHT